MIVVELDYETEKMRKQQKKRKRKIGELEQGFRNQEDDVDDHPASRIFS